MAATIGSQRGRVHPTMWAVTRDQALAIRAQYRAGALIKDLSRKHRVGYGTIQSIVAGRHPAVRDLPNNARERGPRR